MTSKNGLKLALLLSMAVSVGACSSSPARTVASRANDDLFNTKMDLMFATEYPVSGKADAMHRAAQAWSSGDINRALFFYVRALQFDARDAALLAEIGKIHHSQGRRGLAVRAFSMALHIDPDNLASLEGRGLIYLAKGMDDLAEADFRRAVAVSSQSWRAQNGLGVLADHRGEHLIAAVHYDAALQIVPESPVVLNNRGYSSFLAGDYRSATADLHAAAGQYDYQRAWMNLGTVYAREGRYIPAIDMYLKVLDKAETYNRVAEAAIANNDYDTAQELLEMALYESPTYFPSAEDNLAELRMLRQ